MNADVEKAVESLRDVLKFGTDQTKAEFEHVAQALRDQEAEIAMLLEDRDSQQRCAIEAMTRAEKADALLREVVRDEESVDAFNDLLTRITVHLGAEQ